MKILMEEFAASIKWLTRDNNSAHGGQCNNFPYTKTLKFKTYNIINDV